MKLSKADKVVLQEATAIVHCYWNGQRADEMIVQWDKLVAKLNRVAGETTNVSAGAIEQAMLGPAKGKLVKLATGPGYAAASKMATRLSVTVEQATTVGKWLCAQGWLGPQTLLDVLRKWDTWYPKAKALDEKEAKDPRQSATGTGSAATVRRPQGF